MTGVAETKRLKEAGLSMIEITVTLLVVVIILAVTIPSIRNSISAYNLRSAADHMAERIAAVRALAMAKNRNVTFSFNNSSLRYGFDFDGVEGDGVPDETDADDPTITYNSERLPSGITATFPSNDPIKVTFNSRGEMPIGKTDQTIVLRSDSRTIDVKVNLRGKVSVE